jgi:hypothetical protein
VVCLRNIRVDTLHKRDVDDNDDDYDDDNNNNINIINTTAILGEFVMKIWDRYSTLEVEIGSLLWRKMRYCGYRREILKGETESEIIAAQDRKLKNQMPRNKNTENRKTTIVNYVSNMIATLYQHAQD